MSLINQVWVSILVLLEFRPGGWEGIHILPISKVSILVLLEFRPGDNIRYCSTNPGWWFQSLFCWNFVREFADVQPMWEARGSFNPCFAGISSGRDNNWIFLRRPYWVSILVLLEFRPGENASFCSRYARSAFQSLFCWNFVREELRIKCRERISRVSILVLLEFRPGVTVVRTLMDSGKSFNPCFAGISSGSEIQVRCWHTSLVSILVLLEFRPGVLYRNCLI